MTDFNNFNYREINATQSSFIGFVSNGKIYNSFNQQIGVTNDEYKKAIDTAKDYRIICNSLTVLRNDQEKLLEKVQSYLETTLKNTMPIDMPCVPPLHESEVSDV